MVEVLLGVVKVIVWPTVSDSTKEKA